LVARWILVSCPSGKTPQSAWQWLPHILIGQNLEYLASAFGWWTVSAYAKEFSSNDEDETVCLFNEPPDVEWRGSR
jgi:hypothetical protein